MSDIEDTFEPLPDEAQPEAPAEPEPQAEPVEEAAAEPVAAEPAEQPQEPEPQEDPKTVPLATFLSQRDELRDLKKQVETLAEKKVEQPPVEVQPRPDPFEDPEGAARWDAQQIHTRDLARSERMARREYGNDFVEEAFEAAKASGMAGQFAQSQFGWEDMAEWHKANVEAQQAKTALQEIGDPVAYKEKLKAELRAEIQAEMTAQKIKDLPSMANETSIGTRAAPAAPTFTSLDDLL